MATASLIVSTYNWKEALALCLRSVAAQRALPGEVIVADDGSREDTGELVRALAKDFPVPLRHLWQEDAGFRLARARNLGIAASRHDYIVMIDGDLVLHPDFVGDHLAMAQPGSFLQGSRLQATQRYTDRLLAGARAVFAPWTDADFRAAHASERRHTLRIPWLARRKARTGYPGVTVMGANMSFWREDLLRVNGFDERMEGYGSEDLELDLRLRNAGLCRTRLRFAALAIHLHHHSRVPADPEDMTLPNNRILRETRETGATWCDAGISRHLEEFPEPLPDLR